MTKRSITVRLEDGLDARPVALLVQEASKYESNIYFEVDDKRINAKSIMGMMSLGLQRVQMSRPLWTTLKSF